MTTTKTLPYGMTPDMHPDERIARRTEWLRKAREQEWHDRALVARELKRRAARLAPPAQSPPPTFAQYVRATNVALAVEGAPPVSIAGLALPFRQYIEGTLRRELDRRA